MRILLKIQLRSLQVGLANDLHLLGEDLGLAFATFDGHQGIERLLPTASPKADLFSRQSDFVGNLDIECPGECH